MCTMDDECIVANDGEDLCQDRNPIAVASKVWVVVCNSLVAEIYSPHPMVVVIDQCRDVNVSFSFISPNFLDMVFILLSLSRAPPWSLNNTTNWVKSWNAEYESIVHPFCTESSHFIDAVKKIIEVCLFLFNLLQFFGGQFRRALAVPTIPNPNSLSFFITLGKVK